jgi:uncharacterized protein
MSVEMKTSLNFKTLQEPDSSLRWILPIGFLGLSLAVFAWAGPTSLQRGSITIMLVLLVSAMVSSVAGFAFSAIAGAVLYHLVPLPIEAVKIMITCSIAIQIYSVIHLWKHIQWPRLVPFLLRGALTVGPCSWLLLHITAGRWLMAVGVLLVVLGAYMLARKPVTVEVGPNYRTGIDLLTGAIGGIMGPIAALPGPPVTIWCSLQGLDKTQQRVIFQPFILIMQVASLVLISTWSHSKGARFAGFLWVFPAVLGCHLGLLVFERLSDRRFHLMIYALLLASGVSMILKNL